MTEEQRQICIDFQTTFGSPHGKRTLKVLLDESTYEQRYLPSVHPSVTWEDLGKRNMYLFIKDKMDANTAAALQQDAAKVNAAVNQEGVQQETAEE